jgi:hypothetical protein
VVDWNNKQRETFREALQEAYTDYVDLEMFLDEKLDVQLADFAPDEGLRKVTFKLIQWARKEKRLDELFNEFCLNNPSRKDSVITKLQQEPLVKLSRKVSEEDWEQLFDNFETDNFPYIYIAFTEAIFATYNLRFRDMRPDCPYINKLTSIQDLLSAYDNSELAVHFVERAITELRRSYEGAERDLTGLEQWRDRITQQFNVTLKSAASSPKAHHAYLLIAIEEQGADWILYPELHLAGAERPINFGATPITRPIKAVPEQLSEPISTWIEQAEQALEPEAVEGGEVVLEVFLPCERLEQDIATTWRVKDKRGDEVTLENHRWLVVRSFDRIRDRQVQAALKRRWQTLEACVADQTVCRRFHKQTDCPTAKGALCAVLKDEANAPGLKLLTSLPDNFEQRRDALYGIIDAALPIALWSSETTEVDAAALEAEFDALLQSCCIANFADLARQWRKRRRESQAAKPIRLLCDHPDRRPNLPDLTQDSDLLVAS